MKILLIDNDTTLLSQLRALIPGPEIVHRWNDLTNLNSADFDLIILSGGSSFQIVGNETILHDEIAIIREHKKPLIGICYGCELIIESFGGELEKMDTGHQGEVQINVVDTDNDIFKNLEPKFMAYEHHAWQISKVPDEFKILAQSEHSIEMIQHKSLPIFGFQFHPEVLVDQKVGERIFLNILKQVSLVESLHGKYVLEYPNN